MRTARTGLKDQELLRSFDTFNMLMIEQPLWHNDFYFHSLLQRQLETSICLDESIRNRAMRWPPSKWNPAASSISNWDAWVDSAKRFAFTT